MIHMYHLQPSNKPRMKSVFIMFDVIARTSWPYTFCHIYIYNISIVAGLLGRFLGSFFLLLSTSFLMRDDICWFIDANLCILWSAFVITVSKSPMSASKYFSSSHFSFTNVWCSLTPRSRPLSDAFEYFVFTKSYPHQFDQSHIWLIGIASRLLLIWSPLFAMDGDHQEWREFQWSLQLPTEIGTSPWHP